MFPFIITKSSKAQVSESLDGLKFAIRSICIFVKEILSDDVKSCEHNINTRPVLAPSQFCNFS